MQYKVDFYHGCTCMSWVVNTVPLNFKESLNIKLSANTMPTHGNDFQNIIMPFIHCFWRHIYADGGKYIYVCCWNINISLSTNEWMIEHLNPSKSVKVNIIFAVRHEYSIIHCYSRKMHIQYVNLDIQNAQIIVDMLHTTNTYQSASVIRGTQL